MKILVGITGAVGVLGIHSYLLRLAAEPGAEVALMMTATAARIVDPGVLGAVLRCDVIVEPWQERRAVPPAALTNGIDVLLVAPASATTIAYCATGTAANLVAACYLSHVGRSVFAPSMAPEMLAHPATRRNLRTLAEDGATILPSGEGLQIATGRWTPGALCDYATLRDGVLGIEVANGVR
jgi:phosphopantothenoylcysteine decarboxylase/phosphopantothenate--cysteine ligase